MTVAVLKQFGFTPNDHHCTPYGSGLINSTWLVKRINDGQQFILQKINHAVFKVPEDIAANIRIIGQYLHKVHPGYLFVSPILTDDGMDMVITAAGYFRLFPFINGSHTIDVVQDPKQAFEAARQFGRFTKMLAGFDCAQLKITLPDFHNPGFRYRQFERALISGNQQRIAESADLIQMIIKHKTIVDEFEQLKDKLVIRCTHHDTKISNVLFDVNDNGLCVIDLDTVMPGFFISDVGDMMRTYLSPVNEEEKDFSRIMIRPEYYLAIVNGYLCEMVDVLNETEKKYFHYAGQFMIYMQAIRFLTDHINDDIYYGSRYEGHNFVRAGNQSTLLQRLLEFNPG